MKTSLGRRLFTYRRGLGAERTATIWLLLHGWRPLARRYRAAGGEIDLIVRRAGTVAFVEVKRRETMDAALEAVTPRKRRLVGQVARAWLARNPWASEATLRADLLCLAPGHWPRHVPDAFPLE